MTQDEAFLQAIVENPDDDSVRLIYADWLDEHDQTDRAAFIRLQCELATLERNAPRGAELKARERELLAEHEEEWAPLPRVVGARKFERGFLDQVELPAKGFSQLPTIFSVCPTVRQLRLVGRFRSGKPSMRVIAASPYLARLTSLAIIRGCYNIGAEAVRVLVGSPHVGGLTGLSLTDNAIGPGGVVAITTAPLLRNLTSLSLSLYGFRPEEFIGVEAAEALASSPYLTRLSHLRLTSCLIGDQVCRVLAAAPNLTNLNTLDLRNNLISDWMQHELREQFGDRVLL